MIKPNFTHELMAAAVASTIKHWLDTGLASEPAEINRGAAKGGCCDDFKSAVYETLGGMKAAYGHGISELGVDCFIKSNDDMDEGGPFDRDLLHKFWPDVMPTHDLSWDSMDLISDMAGFNPGTHVWMLYDGKHYDCECPQGVRNFFELPFFKRVIDGCLEEMKPAKKIRP